MDYYLTNPTYQVEYRPTGTSTWLPHTSNLSDVRSTIDGLTPAALYDFRVRAWSPNGVPGAWVEVNGIPMEYDTEPPGVPQFRPEDLTTWLRTITVRWNGNAVDASGNPVGMPSDFDFINVWEADNPNMVGAVVVGSMYGAHELWQSGTMPADVPMYYALSAVDRSGNESGLSVVQTVTPKANVNVGEIASKIDAAELELVNIDAGVSIKDDTILARHIVATTDLTAKVAQFLVVEAGMIAANAVTSDTIAAGAITAAKIDANAVTTTQLDAQAITAKHTITAALYRTQVSTNRGIRISSEGIEAWSRGSTYGSPFAAGTKTFMLDEGTGRVDMRDRLVIGGSTWLGASTPGISLVPYGVDGGSGSTGLAGVFINREASTVTDSAGMWVETPSTTAPRDLILKGYQGGGLELRGVGSNIHLDVGGASDDIELTAGGAVILSAPSEVRHAQMAGTTGGAAARVQQLSSGHWVVRRDSSSVRFKAAVEPQPHPAEAILDLEPVTWFEKAAAETVAAYETALAEGWAIDPDLQRAYDDITPLHRIPGLIAEDADAAGLGMYVQYGPDENGTPVPEGLMYDRLWTLLIPVVRDLRDRLTALEGTK